MNAQELYELVEYHHDVWKDHLVWSKDEKRWWSGPCGDDLRACWPIPSELAEAALIGLFVVATGCGLKEFPSEGTHPGGFAAFVWCEGAADVLGHGASRLIALVRSRDVQKEEHP